MGATDDKPKRISSVSYSRLEIFEKCGWWAFLEFVERRPKPVDPTGKGEVAKNRGILIHGEAEKYIRGESNVLVRELQKGQIPELLDRLRTDWPDGHIEVEQDWAFTLDWDKTQWNNWKECWLRVKCDVVEHGDGLLHIVDWKSGKRFGNEVKHSQQGLLYGVASIMRYPDPTDIKITFAYTDEGKVVSKTHKREVLARMLPSFDERLKKVTSTEKFAAKPSKITCRFCPFGPNNGGDRSCPWGVEI